LWLLITFHLIIVTGFSPDKLWKNARDAGKALSECETVTGKGGENSSTNKDHVAGLNKRRAAAQAVPTAEAAAEQKSVELDLEQAKRLKMMNLNNGPKEGVNITSLQANG
jgi:Sec-independent protein translocase protein TatA